MPICTQDTVASYLGPIYQCKKLSYYTKLMYDAFNLADSRTLVFLSTGIHMIY